MDSADRATPEVAEAKAERLKEKIETLKKQMQKLKEIEAESLTVAADRGYYKGLEILACEQAGITTFAPNPLTSGSKAEGRFGKQDFIYLIASDEYRCPAGQCTQA
jgi:hypothetical protein